ncbi:MAG: hypothetical protein AAGG75_22565 [Bacteroidota bacterium]
MDARLPAGRVECLWHFGGRWTVFWGKVVAPLALWVDARLPAGRVDAFGILVDG